MSKLSIKRSAAQLGFTLVEMMVVVMLVALLSSSVLIGVNAITSRQLHSQGDQLKSWLQWAQQSSMLSGSSYGVAEYDQRLFVVAPMLGKWYQVVGIDSWSLQDGMQWVLPEIPGSNFTIGDDQSEFQYSPFMVFSNTGLIEPISAITLKSDGDELRVEWPEGELVTHQAGL